MYRDRKSISDGEDRLVTIVWIIVVIVALIALFWIISGAAAPPRTRRPHDSKGAAAIRSRIKLLEEKALRDFLTGFRERDIFQE
jgi:hypothetical protein